MGVSLSRLFEKYFAWCMIMQFFYGCLMLLPQVSVYYHSPDQAFPFNELVFQQKKKRTYIYNFRKVSVTPVFRAISFSFKCLDPVIQVYWINMEGDHLWDGFNMILRKKRLFFNLYETSVKSPYCLILLSTTYLSLQSFGWAVRQYCVIWGRCSFWNTSLSTFVLLSIPNWFLFRF